MTDDQRPRGSCLAPGCPRDPYRREDGTVPLVCGPCVSRLAHWLREIPALCAELDQRHAEIVRDVAGPRVLADGTPVEPVAVYGPPPARLAAKEPDHPFVLRSGLPVEHRDLVASVLPAGATAGAARGGRVSGSAEPRLPIAVDALDLLAAPRSLRRTAGEDDIGFLPVASTLDFWVQDLRDHRDRGEGLPEPSVTVLAGWLLDRIDEACDDWLPVDEFFDDLRRAHGALRGQLGLVDVPDYKQGVPCPRCEMLALLHRPGSDWVECGDCGGLLTFDEYDDHVRQLAADHKRGRAA